MKKIFVLAASILALAGCAQRSVNIDTPDGELVLTPLADNAVRVQVKGTLATPALEELVYLEGRRHVSFRTEKNDGFTSLQMKGMTVRYDNASATLCIEQRKTLQPYIEECARRVSEEGYTVMRPLVFDFPQDTEALRQDSEYMFGPEYLVCPVLEEGVSEWTVYLPANKGGWEDIRDGRHYDGGIYVTVPVDLEAIPVFRRV